jgi:hypothetical protein
MAGTAFIRYSTADDAFDQDGEKQDIGDTGTELRIPLMADYVVINNLKAFAIIPFISQNKYASSDGKDNSGIGDIWLGAKYAVMPEGLLTVRGALDIPTGDDQKVCGNPGGFGIDVAALTSKKMDKILLNGGVGIRYNTEDSDTKWQPGLGIYLTGSAIYMATEKLPVGVNLTYFNQGDGKYDGNDAKKSVVNWLELAVGTHYLFNETILAGIELEYKLTGTNTPADLGIAIGLGYKLGK